MTTKCKYCAQGHKPRRTDSGKFEHWIVKGLANIAIVDCKDFPQVAAYDPTRQPYDEPFKNGRTPEGCCNPEIDVMIYCDCAKCQGREEWMRALREDVIEGEYGYEPGEFEVYPRLWAALYNEGLTPSQAFKRALNAHRERDEKR